MAPPVPFARAAAFAAAATVASAALVWRRPTPLPGTAALTGVAAALIPHDVAVRALQLGEPRTVAVVGAAVTAYGLVARRGDVLAVVAGSAAALVCVQHVGKPLVGHLMAGTPVFPSGHAAASLACAAMVATAASRTRPTVRYPCWALVAATAALGSAAPVAIGAHYPVDPVGSAAVVATWVCAALAAHRAVTGRAPRAVRHRLVSQ